ncbi:hypothetical protein BH09BAC4_BH09BAC4_33030 [soil metagenome]
MNLFVTIAFLALSGWLLTDPIVPVSVLGHQRALLKAQHLSMAEQRQTVDQQSEKAAILLATNQQRARIHIPELKPDAKLMQAAQQYAELMAIKDQMSHTLNGLSLVDKANRVGYSYRQLRENIALNTRLDGRFVVINQWMESKGHRKNLLTKDLTDIGIGIAGPSKQNRYYYCQLFGTPL